MTKNPLKIFLVGVLSTSAVILSVSSAQAFYVNIARSAGANYGAFSDLNECMDDNFGDPCEFVLNCTTSKASYDVYLSADENRLLANDYNNGMSFEFSFAGNNDFETCIYP